MPAREVGGVGLVCLDPLIEFHDLNESDNGDMHFIAARRAIPQHFVEFGDAYGVCLLVRGVPAPRLSRPLPRRE
jgi:hypothetical protein